MRSVSVNDDLIAVLSLVLTAIALGLALGLGLR